MDTERPAEFGWWSSTSPTVMVCCLWLLQCFVHQLCKWKGDQPKKDVGIFILTGLKRQLCNQSIYAVHQNESFNQDQPELLLGSKFIKHHCNKNVWKPVLLATVTLKRRWVCDASTVFNSYRNVKINIQCHLTVGNYILNLAKQERVKDTHQWVANDFTLVKI